MMQSSPLTFRRVIIWIGRLGLGGTFIYAGYVKLFFPTFIPSLHTGVALAYFAMQVDSYQMLPLWAVNIVAHTLPLVEMGLGLLLLLGWQLRLWMTLLSLLVAGFFAGVLRAYLLHLQINCGCFATPEPLTIKTVIRDGLLLALMVVLTVFVYQEARKPHAWSAPEKA